MTFSFIGNGIIVKSKFMTSNQLYFYVLIKYIQFKSGYKLLIVIFISE